MLSCLSVLETLEVIETLESLIEKTKSSSIKDCDVVNLYVCPPCGGDISDGDSG